MFLRRRSRAREVHLSLPRGRQLEITLPKQLANRLPAAKTGPRPRAIGAIVAAFGAGLLYLVGLAARRRNEPPATQTPSTPPAHGVTGSDSESQNVTPAAQPPTSDREPEEIEQLASLNSTQKSGSPRR